jgi:hypothetical protein
VRVVVVFVEPYRVGATSEVVVVRVDDAGLSTNVQFVKRPRVLRASRLRAMDFMMVRFGLSVPLVLPTAGD